MRFCVWVLINLFSTSVAASGVMDLNVFYFTDDLSADTDTTNQRTFYKFLLGFSVDKKDFYQVGWNYAGYSTSDKAAAGTTTYSSSQMGPGVLIHFDKQRHWRLGLAYNLVTTGKYKAAGGTSEDWRGTGMSGDFTYVFRSESGLGFGISMNYSQTSYNEKKVGSATTDVSFTRTHMYPSVNLTFDFL